MLEVNDLTVMTDKKELLLEGISFKLKPGCCVGLTGASGSGKTTLLKALIGVSDSNVEKGKGEILLDGNNLLFEKTSVRRKLCGTRFGLIPQNPASAFVDRVSVGSQMSTIFHKRLNIEKRKANELSRTLLKQVNLPDIDRIYYARPRQLSGGMLQRITVAVLLGLKPQYILADEPTSALDDENKGYIIEELRRLKKDCAVFFVSHDDRALQSLCDELLVMQNGRIIERGITEELMDHPQSEWMQDFIGLTSSQGEGWTWEKL